MFSCVRAFTVPLYHFEHHLAIMIMIQFQHEPLLRIRSFVKLRAESCVPMHIEMNITVSDTCLAASLRTRHLYISSSSNTVYTSLHSKLDSTQHTSTVYVMPVESTSLWFPIPTSISFLLPNRLPRCIHSRHGRSLCACDSLCFHKKCHSCDRRL